jgi:hypothetical protein
MADWSLPTLTSTYANFRQNLTDRDVDAAIQFQTGSPTNIPTNAVKWDTTLNRWQKWSGTAWAELTASYALTGLTCTSFSNTGNTTLGDASADSVTVNAATFTFVNTTTVAGNLTLTGAVSFTGNTTLGDTAGDSVTFNAATLTFANATTISGSLTYSGAVVFGGGVTLGDAAGDAVTFVSNTATVPAGGFTFSGGIVNFSTGLQSGGVAVLTNSSTSTVTNKTLSTGNVIDAGTSVSDTGTIAASSTGFRGVPLNSRTSAYTLVLTDAGKSIPNTTGGWAIPANGTTAFPVGTTIAVINTSASPQTITITTDTLRWAGVGTTGTRTLAAYGLATIIKVAATEWYISGAGLS